MIVDIASLKDLVEHIRLMTTAWFHVISLISDVILQIPFLLESGNTTRLRCAFPIILSAVVTGYRVSIARSRLVRSRRDFGILKCSQRRALTLRRKGVFKEA